MKTIQGLSVRDAILRMAVPTFVELGYEKASMDEVAARAETTKRTVYAHFGNKEELFRAALGKAVQLFQSELPQLDDTADPAAALERYAIRFSELCTWRGPVRLQRVVMSESERFADLGAMLHRDVIERAERQLTDYFERLRQARHADPDPAAPGWAATMAKLFLNMTTAPQRFATLLAARDMPDHHPHVETPPDTDHAYIRDALRVFLKGTGLGT